jgi:hypothetical protein
MTSYDMDKSERAGVAIRDASAKVQAPASLRADIAAERLARPGRPRPTRWVPLAAGVAAAVVAAVLVFSFDPGTSSPTDVAAATGAALRPATGPAPVARGRVIDAHVGSVQFPNYSYGLPYRATGVRHDTIAGRNAVTVFYSAGKQRVGYTVLDGKSLPVPSSARPVSFADFDAFAFSKNAARVITWRRDGHTCILASRTADEATMLQLAAWT